MLGGGASTATGTGLTTSYNLSHGIEFDDIVSGSLTFNNNSAFTANAFCGLKNSTSVNVNAVNNQWRNALVAPTPCASSIDRCSGPGEGPVVCDPVQNYKDSDIFVDSNPLPSTVPSNVILRGQTVRVQGVGFNAIDGNPPDSVANCMSGSDISSNNCCRNTLKANLCNTDTPPGPVASKGNCVALRNGANQWKIPAVTSVTPTTIVTEVPAANPVFACVGASSEKVRVSKRTSTGMDEVDERDYCLNTTTL